MEITIEDFDFGSTGCGGNSARSISDAHDDRLVSAAAAGDDDAFRQLVELHQERVFQFCYRWLRDSEDAREATQDAFLRVYESIPRYQRRAKFTTWLYAIALNRCRDQYKSKVSRQRRKTRGIGDGELHSVCPSAQPDEMAKRVDDHEWMRKAILKLPEKLRSAVVLFALEGLSQKDCAEILNCSERAVEGRLYRARDILKTVEKSHC